MHIESDLGKGLTVYNCNENRLHGVFEATTDGALNIEEFAFDGRFPAQVRVRWKTRCPSQDSSTLLHLIKRGWITSSRRGVLLFPSKLHPKFIDELWRVFLQIPYVPKPDNELPSMLHKQMATNGHPAMSYGEKLLDDWLSKHIPYGHEHGYLLKKGGREVLCDWYIPKIELYIEYWEKARREPGVIQSKQKFYEDHSLKMINVYEDDLPLADRIIPARIRQTAPQCKFRELD